MKKVLVVDDDEDFRAISSAFESGLLQTNGPRVTRTGDIQDVLRYGIKSMYGLLRV